MNLPPLGRVPLLLLGFVGLVIGVGAGLARLGWAVPEIAAAAAGLHGALMICGFFGVVISLERAVAIGRLWAYAAPLLAGLGTLAALSGASSLAGWLYLGSSVLLLIGSMDIVRRQPALFTVTIALGAACWGVGNARWAAGFDASSVVPWWLAFLILTIAGERLELSRFMPPSALAQRVFGALLVVAAIGLVGAGRAWGASVFASALLGLAAWLFKQDIARRTVHQRGLTRFIAVCLLSGYFWLGLGGAVILGAGGLTSGTASYDAALHALAVGFVFSMVFGHAPIIFPAVLRVAVPYHPSFYVPLALLHGALALRVAGDAAGQLGWTRWGALLTALALAAFIVNTASAVWRGRRAADRQ